jgi:hypothetical protein
MYRGKNPHQNFPTGDILCESPVLEKSRKALKSATGAGIQASQIGKTTPAT